MNNQLTLAERQDRARRLKALLEPRGLSVELDEKISLTIERFISKLDEVSFTLKTVEGLQGGQLETSLTGLISVLEADTSGHALRRAMSELVVRLDASAVLMRTHMDASDKAKAKTDHAVLEQLKDLTVALAAVNELPSKLGHLKAELVNPDQIIALMGNLDAMISACMKMLEPDLPYTATFTRDNRNRISSITEQCPDYTMTTIFDRDDMGRITVVRTNETA